MGQTNQPLERSRGRVSSLNRAPRSIGSAVTGGCRGLSSYTTPSCGPMVSGVAYEVYHGGGLTCAYPTLRAYHLFDAYLLERGFVGSFDRSISEIPR